MTNSPVATSETSATEKALATAPTRTIRVVEDQSAHLFDTARFEHMSRIANVMASATLIPDHLWKDKNGNFDENQVRANCFLIVNQAVRWGMDPFAITPETYVVGGKLGFQGKLIAALMNSRAPIVHALRYEFSGTKGTDAFTVRVFSTLVGEDAPRDITLSVGEAKTDNQMWKRDPEQKLIYSGATKWARRHCPEIILGVLTDDDLEHIQANQGFENAIQVNAPVPPSFVRGKKKLELTPAASESVDTALASAPALAVSDAKAEAPTLKTEAAKTPAASADANLTSEGGAKHEAVTKKPAASHSAATPQAASAQEQSPFTDGPKAAATPPAPAATTPPAEEESPLLKDIRAIQQTYGITDDQVLAFAKESAVLGRHSRLLLPDLADSALSLILNGKDKLIAKFTSAQQA